MSQRNCIVQGTSGVPVFIELSEDIQTKADLLPVLKANGVDTTSMEMVVVETSVTLDLPEAVLPTTDFMLVLAPAKIKGNSDIPELPTVDAVADMEYVEVRGELKKLKAYAVDVDNEQLELIIGNYSSIKVPEMKERLITAINFLQPPVPAASETGTAPAADLTPILATIAEFNERVAALSDQVTTLIERIGVTEGRLGIINPHNVGDWDTKVKAVKASIANKKK